MALPRPGHNAHRMHSCGVVREQLAILAVVCHHIWQDGLHDLGSAPRGNNDVKSVGKIRRRYEGIDVGTNPKPRGDIERFRQGDALQRDCSIPASSSTTSRRASSFANKLFLSALAPKARLSSVSTELGTPGKPSRARF